MCDKIIPEKGCKSMYFLLRVYRELIMREFYLFQRRFDIECPNPENLNPNSFLQIPSIFYKRQFRHFLHFNTRKTKFLHNFSFYQVHASAFKWI